MRPPLLLRIRWWLDELREGSPLARLHGRVAGLRSGATEGRIVLGSLLALVLLVGGGFAAGRAVAGASGADSQRKAVHVVTTRQKVRVRVHGRIVTRWRTRRLYAEARTVMQTQTIHTAHGIRVVRRPVTRYRVVYRKRATRTVSRPVTSLQTRTSTSTSTRVVTVTNQVTNVQTVTRPVTIVQTTTVVSTRTDTLPITVTVTVPTVP